VCTNLGPRPPLVSDLQQHDGWETCQRPFTRTLCL
jgi:hypothetical protein